MGTLDGFRHCPVSLMGTWVNILPVHLIGKLLLDEFGDYEKNIGDRYDETRQFCPSLCGKVIPKGKCVMCAKSETRGRQVMAVSES